MEPDSPVLVYQEEEEEKTPSSAQKKKYGKDDRPSLNIKSGKEEI